jgi:hypothetical protein
MTEHWVWSKTSTICLRQGTLASITSSARTVAKGSDPYQFARAEHGVAEAAGFFLPRVGDVDEVGDLAHKGQQIFLFARFEEVFELEADIEMVFDGGLAPAGDHNDVGDPGVDDLFDGVLDDGLVDQRQHLFGLGLGGGEEAGPRPAAGKTALRSFMGIETVVGR